MATTPSPVTPLNLEQVAALCDELAALARCELPLDASLQLAAQQTRKDLSPLLSDLAERSAAGVTVQELFQSPTLERMPMLQAIVMAGVRSGRLHIALEELADSLRRVLELRRTLWLSLLYPLIILSLVAILSTVLLGQLVRQYEHFQAFQEIGSGPWPWLDVQLWAARWVGSWIWLPAVLILACAVIWRVRSGRASPSGIHRGWIRWLPGGRRMLLAMQRANFSDLLAILIDHQVPLPDAVRLAAGASGVGTMERDVERWAEALERGQTSGQRAKVPIVSPLAGWFLDHAANSELLVQALRSSAQADRRRADAQAAWLRLQLPLLLTFLIGGSLTAIYAFAVMGPWYNLLRQMERLL